MFSLRRRVNQEELEAFAASWNLDDGVSCRPCCGPDYFRFDLTSKPKSPWNRSAARVFATDFITTYQVSKRAFDDIVASFFVRVKTLQAQYRLRLKGPMTVLMSKVQRRREYRKYTVSITGPLFPRMIASMMFSFFSGGYLLQHSYLSYDVMSACWRGWEWLACRVTNLTLWKPSVTHPHRKTTHAIELNGLVGEHL